MKNEKVSIIVPVYNVEKYLEACLISLVNQDYENTEIILVDDGSTDGSLKICKTFEKDYHNVKVLEQKNSGVSVARNNGIENSTGEWICFIDSDDYIEKNMITRMVEISRGEQFDILITPPIMDYDSISKKGKIFDHDMDFTSDNKDELLFNIICRQYGNKYSTEIGAGGPWGKLYRSKFIKENNLRFIVGLKRMQDVLFNLYAMNLANKVIYREEFLYHYRLNASSVCFKYNPNIFNIFDSVIKNMLLFAKENNMGKEYYQCIYLKTILLYIEGSRIGIVHKDNHDKFNSKVKKLRSIYENEIYKNAFSSIEKKELNFKLKVFTIFVKLRMFSVVYLLILIFNNMKAKEQQ